MKIQTCPKDLPPDLEGHLIRFSKAWAISKLRPQPSSDLENHWDSLVKAWVGDTTLPLFIRKPSEGRGRAVAHPAGRTLIPVDNSPPHWSFIAALKGKLLSIEDIHHAIAGDKIPVAMVMKKDERENAVLNRTRTKSENLNAAGWKLAHINPVGLNSRRRLIEMDIDQLVKHFEQLMSPSNMFVVPLELAGLGEMHYMISAMMDWKHNRDRDNG